MCTFIWISGLYSKACQLGMQLYHEVEVYRGLSQGWANVCGYGKRVWRGANQAEASVLPVRDILAECKNELLKSKVEITPVEAVSM